MITLSDRAAAQLQHLLAERGAADHGLRIFVEGGGCAGLQYGMYYEERSREGDAVLDVGGVRLYVDPFSAEYLEGAAIDYDDGPPAAGFRVDNPNAAATCACGSSFCTEARR